MPNFIPKNQEPIWDKAVKTFKKQYGREPKESEDWAIVSSIFKKMNGKFENVKEMLELFNIFQENNKMKVIERLNKLYEKVVLKEAKFKVGDKVKTQDKEVMTITSIRNISKGEVTVKDKNNKTYVWNIKNLSKESLSLKEDDVSFVHAKI